jgi:hypothetical protein
MGIERQWDEPAKSLAALGYTLGRRDRDSRPKGGTKNSRHGANDKHTTGKDHVLDVSL